MKDAGTIDFGALVISLDFELHWGVRDHLRPTDGYRQNLLGAREAVPAMLGLFEEFEVAATWATVGFLFAETAAELRSFSPRLRPQYLDARLSPYDEPVGRDELDDPLHFAPSLIERIAEAKGQEIASHTYSHYFCLEPGQEIAAFRADLQSAVRIASARGLALRSIVFPRNQVNAAYAEVLLELGIRCYRGTERSFLYPADSYASVRKPHLRLLRLTDRYLDLTGSHVVEWGSVAQPNGLFNVASSRALAAYSPRLAPLEPLRLRRIRRAMEEAARKRGIFHLWWHPHNFGSDLEENMRFLRSVLEHYARCRERYGMRSLSMAGVAEVILQAGAVRAPRTPATIYREAAANG